MDTRTDVLVSDGDMYYFGGNRDVKKSFSVLKPERWIGFQS